MLAYVGNLLKIVVPNIAEEEYRLILKKHPFLWLLLKLKGLASLLDNDSDAVVKFLKNKGDAFIINSLTHLGTVVYQKSEDEKYVYLKPEADIREVLDVKNEKEFAQLWGWENYPDKPLKNYNFLQNLLSAHLHVFRFTNTIRANANIK